MESLAEPPCAAAELVEGHHGRTHLETALMARAILKEGVEGHGVVNGVGGLSALWRFLRWIGFLTHHRRRQIFGGQHLSLEDDRLVVVVWDLFAGPAAPENSA